MTINEKLQTIQRLVREVEDELSTGHSTKTPRRATTPADAEKKTLRDYILALKSGGFFGTARTASEVHVELSKTYQCMAKRVGVELIRMHKGKQLRKMAKQEDGRSKVAYVA